jgi:hypothetical protein
MEITDIFTEFNSELINQVDRDPLGFQQIWTHFGQKIFDNKTTSVATDIRNYTINLFHHNIVRKLPEKCNLFWKTVSKKNYKEGIEKSIILLEMMLSHSRVISGNKWKEPRGILGTSMAFNRWDNGKEDTVNLEALLSDPKWDKTNKNRLFEMLLVRQTTLGINGRYKGPFIKMKFFDSNYNYSGCFSTQWEKIDSEINKNDNLKYLEQIIFKCLKNIEKEITFSSSSSWIEGYKNTFNSHETTADFSFAFWPEYLGFNTGASKAIFDFVLQNKPCENNFRIKDIYENALKNINLNEKEDINHIQNILNIEPILAQFDIIFQLILKTQNYKIKINPQLQKSINDYQIPNGAPTRLITLIKNIKENKDIVKSLIEHHEKVMKERGNMPWLKILQNGELKVYQQVQVDNNIEELQNNLNSEDKWWIHPYYIPSVREIVCGMIKGK